MSRSGTYQIRIDKQEKKETFAVLHDLGITPSQAVKLFFAQVRNTRSIPFPLEHKPNSKTIQAIEEAKRGENLVVCKDADDLFNKLGI
ncbi:MAG: type II toxin-antitoxin system RelB/DinJ family antitoxin [Methylovulum sp.]|nr:type II toxin-antitoxin system RelB/DinJ family antitoxin [Methylovulum sp.]MCF7998322.1 type II toxin-antitoxin system RelB/DinJ family antitoxin [Methylovulum sp.]